MFDKTFLTFSKGITKAALIITFWFCVCVCCSSSWRQDLSILLQILTLDIWYMQFALSVSTHLSGMLLPPELSFKWSSCSWVFHMDFCYYINWLHINCVIVVRHRSIYSYNWNLTINMYVILLGNFWITLMIVNPQFLRDIPSESVLSVRIAMHSLGIQDCYLTRINIHIKNYTDVTYVALPLTSHSLSHIAR